MGLIDIVPVSIRLAFLYSKAGKIAKQEGMSNEEKLQKIYCLENYWKGKSGFNPMSVGEGQAPAICIGKKDMARIFTSLHSPDDALRYVDGLGNLLMDILNRIPDNEQNANKRDSVYEAQIFAWYYEAVSYAQKNDAERSRLLFNKINQNMLVTIESNPSNKRLNDVYHYMINETFNTFIDMANEFPAQKQEVYKALLNLLKTFDQRDPGNEHITDLISRFH